MKVSTEIDNNFVYEKITQLVDNIPLIQKKWCILRYHWDVPQMNKTINFGPFHIFKGQMPET
jgi:hypothetical protein